MMLNSRSAPTFFKYSSSFLNTSFQPRLVRRPLIYVLPIEYPQQLLLPMVFRVAVLLSLASRGGTILVANWRSQHSVHLLSASRANLHRDASGIVIHSASRFILYRGPSCIAIHAASRFILHRGPFLLLHQVSIG